MSGLWGAGFIGPDGTDYVALESDGIRKRMGQGLYSQDPHGTMGQWRDLFAIPLALFHNLIDYIVANANPGTAEDMLPYWEQVLGIAFWADRLSISQRQTRCKEVLRRWATYPGGPTSVPADAGFPTEWNIYRQFYAIHYRALGIGPTGFATTGPAQYTLTVAAAMWDVGNSYWLNELTRARDRLCPAWGEILIV